jgi:hypothetical protein
MIASSGTRITSTSVASQSGIRFARCSAMASSAIRMLQRKPVSRYELTHTRPLFGEAGVPPSCAKAPRPCRPPSSGHSRAFRPVTATSGTKSQRCPLSLPGCTARGSNARPRHGLCGSHLITPCGPCLPRTRTIVIR